MSIPKKIHYCWLSGSKMPRNLINCMKTWNEIMPDYEIILWDKNRFDINSINFVKEAYLAKKWAFACDYIRLYALYTEGGIYFDSDVVVKKRFDEFLGYAFFTGIEYQVESFKKNNSISLLNEDGVPKFSKRPIHGLGIQGAIMGSEKEHPFLKDCLDNYIDKSFLNNSMNSLIISDILALVGEKYGFRYKNERQNLQNGMEIFPTSVFAPRASLLQENTYALHYCMGSWTDVSLFSKIKVKLSKNNFIRGLFRKTKV